MGCGGSTPVDLAEVNGGMNSSNIGPVNGTQVGFVLKQKMFSWSGDDFVIKNHTEAEAFKIKGNALSLRDKMHITDPEGKKLAVLQRKLMALRPTFYVYSYTPNFEGQESTEEDRDKEPVYRYAFVQDQFASLLGRQIVKKFTTSNEEKEAVGVFEIFVQAAIKFKCRIKKYMTPEEKKAKDKDEEQQVIATAGETSFFQWEGKTTLAIEMATGCDVLLILCGMIASEKIKEDKQKK